MRTCAPDRMLRNNYTHRRGGRTHTRDGWQDARMLPLWLLWVLCTAMRSQAKNLRELDALPSLMMRLMEERGAVAATGTRGGVPVPKAGAADQIACFVFRLYSRRCSPVYRCAAGVVYRCAAENYG